MQNISIAKTKFNFMANQIYTSKMHLNGDAGDELIESLKENKKTHEGFQYNDHLVSSVMKWGNAICMSHTVAGPNAENTR